MWHLSSPCGGCLPIGSTVFGYPCCRCWRCWPARALAGVPSVGGAGCSRGCCWPAWGPTSWWPRRDGATPGSSPSNNSATIRGWIDPWHGYSTTTPTEGGVLAVGDAAVFDLKPPVLLQHLFRRLHLRAVGQGQDGRGDPGRVGVAADRLRLRQLGRDRTAIAAPTASPTLFSPRSSIGWSSKGCWRRCRRCGGIRASLSCPARARSQAGHESLWQAGRDRLEWSV